MTKISLGSLVELGALFGFSSRTCQDYLLLYIPLHLFSEGNKSAMLKDLSMLIVVPDSDIPMYLMKKGQGKRVEDIEGEKPIFPTFEEAKQGNLATAAV